MTTGDKIGKLEEEALNRKERLKALKIKKNNSESCETKQKGEEKIPKPVFRNYLPHDNNLKETVLEPTKPGDVELEIKDQLEAAKSRVLLEDLDLTSLAPRKADWDLKRDASKKLERLEKRTQRAIAELIRERLKTEQGDLASKVAIGADAASCTIDEED